MTRPGAHRCAASPHGRATPALPGNSPALAQELHQLGAAVTITADYLFARFAGHFASLMSLINRGCLRAIRSGHERLEEELMNQVKNHAAAEEARKGTGSRDQSRPQDHTAPPGSTTPEEVGMTGWTNERIPIGVAPAPGEALDSWLERYAQRLTWTISVCPTRPRARWSGA
ncbi:hypothetical protein [Streptomyces sp. NPDC045470]|uniref:hypothetical protein n=1 Tax=Streptomyces sp. NPDC045470 TaxID=3155469 RepID=UPI0033D70225